MDVKCPECQQSDLLVRLSGISLRAEDQARVDFRLVFETTANKGEGKQIFLFPEACQSCGAPVSDVSLTGERALKCEYCSRRINPRGILEVPRLRHVTREKQLKGPRRIAENLSKSAFQKSAWVDLRQYLELPNKEDLGEFYKMLFLIFLFLLWFISSFSSGIRGLISFAPILLFALALNYLINGTRKSDFENNSRAADKTFEAGLEILYRSVYCFRDDLCYDPIGKRSWRAKETKKLFELTKEE